MKLAGIGTERVIRSERNTYTSSKLALSGHLGPQITVLAVSLVLQESETNSTELAVGRALQ